MRLIIVIFGIIFNIPAIGEDDGEVIGATEDVRVEVDVEVGGEDTWIAVFGGGGGGEGGGGGGGEEEAEDDVGGGGVVEGGGGGGGGGGRGEEAGLLGDGAEGLVGEGGVDDDGAAGCVVVSYGGAWPFFLVGWYHVFFF